MRLRQTPTHQILPVSAGVEAGRREGEREGGEREDDGGIIMMMMDDVQYCLLLSR